MVRSVVSPLTSKRWNFWIVSQAYFTKLTNIGQIFLYDTAKQVGFLPSFNGDNPTFFHVAGYRLLVGRITGPSAVTPRCDRHGIESNGTLASNIVGFGWAQYIGAVTNGKVTDKPRLVSHNLTRVSGILSKLLLDIVLGEHDSKISPFRIGDMNFDVLAATKHIPGFGI